MYTTNIEIDIVGRKRHLEVKYTKDFVIENIVDLDTRWCLNDGLGYGVLREIEEIIEESHSNEKE